MAWQQIHSRNKKIIITQLFIPIQAGALHACILNLFAYNSRSVAPKKFRFLDPLCERNPAGRMVQIPSDISPDHSKSNQERPVEKVMSSKLRQKNGTGVLPPKTSVRALHDV